MLDWRVAIAAEQCSMWMYPVDCRGGRWGAKLCGQLGGS